MRSKCFALSLMLYKLQTGLKQNLMLAGTTVPAHLSVRKKYTRYII